MLVDVLLADLLAGNRLFLLERLTQSLNNDVPDLDAPWLGRRQPPPSARAAPPPPPHGHLEGWKWYVTRGCPEITVTVDEWSEDGSKIGGHWQSSPGTFHVTCNTPTLVRLLEGHIRLTPLGACAIDLAAGDTFTFAPGFKGDWDNRTATRQRFALVRI